MAGYYFKQLELEKFEFKKFEEARISHSKVFGQQAKLISAVKPSAQMDVRPLAISS